ncbi:hypothetical protein C8Q80DRAFT_1276317 [Daedaleopsis nitida]|nr:hypothetical protein C8Q80DRAFT_1276317 [Daedaleopsis nitida]
MRSPNEPFAGGDPFGTLVWPKFILAELHHARARRRPCSPKGGFSAAAPPWIHQPIRSPSELFAITDPLSSSPSRIRHPAPHSVRIRHSTLSPRMWSFSGYLQPISSPSIHFAAPDSLGPPLAASPSSLPNSPLPILSGVDKPPPRRGIPPPSSTLASRQEPAPLPPLLSGFASPSPPYAPAAPPPHLTGFDTPSSRRASDPLSMLPGPTTPPPFHSETTSSASPPPLLLGFAAVSPLSPLPNLITLPPPQASSPPPLLVGFATPSHSPPPLLVGFATPPHSPFPSLLCGFATP